MAPRLTVLVVGLALLSLVQAAEVSKHHHHHHRHKLHEVPPVVPPFFGAPGFLPVAGAMPFEPLAVPPVAGVPAAAAGVDPIADLFPRFQQTGATADAAAKTETSSPNVYQSLYNLLSKQRDTTEADVGELAQLKKLNEEQFQTLTRKAHQLHDRQSLLTRLQWCLEQDNSESAKAKLANDANVKLLNAMKEEAEKAAKQAGFNKAKEIELKEREERLEAARKDLAAKEKAVSDRMAAAQVLQAKATAAQNAPPKEVVKTVVEKVPEIVYRVAPTGCPALSDCSTCAASPSCGWCQSSGKCLDSLNGTTSECDADSWSFNFCKHDSCKKHVHCRSCMADPRCGMCADTGMCTEGSLMGPTAGSCNAWSYATDMRFLSYNMYGRDLRNLTGRAEWLFRLIRQADADFVALQEVEDWFLEALAKEKWALNYHMSDFGSGHAPGGLLMLSKIPLESVSYYEKTDPGQVEVDQRARFLTVKPKLGSRNLVLANTMLDWRNPISRVAGLEYMFSVLNASSDVVAMGDFNFDTGAMPETAHVPSNYIDMWPRLHPSLKGYTWDPEQNSYARESDPTSRPSRIDRMYVRSGFWQPSKINKIGAPEASPHYGLLAEFSMFGAYC